MNSLITHALPPFLAANPEWIVAGLIVLLGLVLYGIKDLIHFSFTRVWAISGVCFAESIRRRVLWIIPLTILGVVIVSQLQHPTDEQDAIRQTTKFCLFATGLVVTITAIILACTNLPKEIENRVIYTIVTKPTTRLEIVLGKVLGFARVSATILLIMGLFTLGYIQVRAWSLGAAIDQQLKEGITEPATLATLTHYKEAGLLNARTYANADDMQILSREPKPGDNRRWLFGGEGNFMVPFHVTREDLISSDDQTATPGLYGVAIVAYIGYQASVFGDQPKTPESAIPDSIAAPATKPDASASQPATPLQSPPFVTFEILDENQNTLIPETAINGGKPVLLSGPNASGRLGLTIAMIPPDQVESLLKTATIYVQVRGVTPDFEYSAGLEPVALVIPPLHANARTIHAVPSHHDPTRVTAPAFGTKPGVSGMQLRGGASNTPLAIYHFHDVQTQPDYFGNVPLELRVGIERGGGSDDSDAPTVVEATVVDHLDPTHPELDRRTPVLVSPELGRTAFFTVPASAVEGGTFDVQLHCLTTSHFIGVQTTSLNLVISEHSFAVNLGKSLLVLWLMSLLVVIVSIFCSTFLSWPIAIVLTVLILLGRWGVVQLGDATAPGIGNQVATDMGLVRGDPSKAKVVSDTVEALAKMLNLLAKVLPDITRFSALEDIERGIYLPMTRLTDSLLVIGSFGLPMVVLAYVFLRNKEVAP